MFHFQPSYAMNLLSNVRNRSTVTGLVISATLITVLGVAIPHRLVRFGCLTVGFTLVSFARVARREMLHTEWQMEIHRVASSSQYTLNTFNAYTNVGNPIHIPTNYPPTVAPPKD